MAARCCFTGCDKEIPPERQIALIQANTPIERWTCIEHGFKGKIVGFMSESSGGTGDIRNVGRKGGYILTVLTSEDPNFKENLRLAERVKRRSR